MLKQVNQRGDEIGINDGLYLIAVSSGDIGYRPTSLFSDRFSRAGKKAQEGWKGSAVDNDLGLDIITRHDVTDRTKSWGLNLSSDKIKDGLHCRLRMHKQLDKSPRNARLNNSLDLLIGTIREVGNGPTSIDQHLIIQRIDQLSKHW